MTIARIYSFIYWLARGFKYGDIGVMSIAFAVLLPIVIIIIGLFIKYKKVTNLFHNKRYLYLIYTGVLILFWEAIIIYAFYITPW